MRNPLRSCVPLVLIVAAGCNVTDENIDHWKRTQRGPGKIQAVLVGSKYPEALRIHAARALIEMKHPNASGLDLLVQALAAVPAPDRERIIHALLEPLKAQLGGTAQGAQASGPTEAQIKAKDAAYLLLRYASADDRREIANQLLTWMLADLGGRSLAGRYTAEQIVTAIGPSAVDRLVEGYRTSDSALPVIRPLTDLISAVATDAGKDTAARRLVAVAAEVAAPGFDAQLRTTVTGLLQRGANAPAPAPERVTRAMGATREQYMSWTFEGLQKLARPAAAEYLVRVAVDPQAPLPRRKLALTAAAGFVHASETQPLLSLARGEAGADLELRGLAVDRLGEARDPNSAAGLWTLFDTVNGGEENQEFMLRWKLGEALLKIGGPTAIPTFVQHLQTRRPAPFGGYTYAEINGYALTLGDFSPPPRDAVRGLLAGPDPYVRAVALLFLGGKGDATDGARIDAALNDATPMTGAGWSAIAPAGTAAGAPATLSFAARKAKDQWTRAQGQPQAQPAVPR